MEVFSENCGSCGACVSVCPNNIIKLTENYINLESGCKRCGLCLIVCPLGAIKDSDSDEV